MAAAFKLPVVFVLQNNRYSISVSVEKATGMEHLAIRAKAYNIPGLSCAVAVIPRTRPPLVTMPLSDAAVPA